MALHLSASSPHAHLLALAVEDHGAAGAAQALVGGGGHHISVLKGRGHNAGGNLGREGGVGGQLGGQQDSGTVSGNTAGQRSWFFTTLTPSTKSPHQARDVRHVGQQDCVVLVGHSAHAGVVVVPSVRAGACHKQLGPARGQAKGLLEVRQGGNSIAAHRGLARALQAGCQTAGRNGRRPSHPSHFTCYHQCDRLPPLHLKQPGTGQVHQAAAHLNSAAVFSIMS